MFKKGIFTLMILLSQVSFSADAGKTILTIKGMVCSFCAQGIEKKLKAQKEVKAVNVDLDTKKVEIEFQAGQIVDTEVLKKIIIDSGYDVVKVESL